MATWAELVAGLDGWLAQCRLAYDDHRLARMLLTDRAHWDGLLERVRVDTGPCGPDLGAELAYVIASRSHEPGAAPVGWADDMGVFIDCWRAVQTRGAFPHDRATEDDVPATVVPELEFAAVYGSVCDRSGPPLQLPMREDPWPQALWLAGAMVDSAVREASRLVASHDPPRSGRAMRDRTDGSLNSQSAQFIAGQLVFGRCWCARPNGAAHTWGSWDPDRFWVRAHVAQVVRGSATPKLLASNLRDKGAIYEFLTDIDIIVANHAARFVCACDHFDDGALAREAARPEHEERRRRSSRHADRCDLEGEHGHARTLANTYVWGQKNAVVTRDRPDEPWAGWENLDRWWLCKQCENLAYVPPLCPRCAAEGRITPLPGATPGRFAAGEFDCHLCEDTSAWTFPCPWCCQTTVGPGARYTEVYTLDGAQIPWDFHVSHRAAPGACGHD